MIDLNLASDPPCLPSYFAPVNTSHEDDDSDDDDDDDDEDDGNDDDDDEFDE